MIKHETARRYVQTLVLLLSFMLFLTTSCKRETAEYYHRFPDKAWKRFNTLSFTIPVTKTGKKDLRFFARFNANYRHDSLAFNMVMNNSAGEERIRAYRIRVKSSNGSSLLACRGDSCEGTVLLKGELMITKPGVLTIEIENLMPYMVTEEILGVGILMEDSGK
jgi:gliding motility-associated lipoprotein GldH